MEAVAQHFSTRHEFEAHFRLLLARSSERLQLFDPDFSCWPLGASDIDAALRHFLVGKGSLQLVAHHNAYLERQCPRFLRLLKDFGHAIECRVTGKNLRHLTDSFCIGDHRHLLRRFHSDHMRGEAGFDQPSSLKMCAERFDAIWSESDPGLHVSTTGL